MVFTQQQVKPGIQIAISKLVLKVTLTKRLGREESLTTLWYHVPRLLSRQSLQTFYTFLCAVSQTLIRSVQFINHLKINSVYSVNLKNKHPKVNFLDLVTQKKYVYSLGLLIRYMGDYKKSDRRVLKMLKFLITFAVKKIQIQVVDVTEKCVLNCLLTLKGLSKNLLKIIYFLKIVFINLNVYCFYIKPLKTLSLTNVKICRAIKRRIRKRIIKFEQI